MRQFLLLLVLSGLGCLPVFAGALLITNVNIVSAERENILSNAFVEVRDGVIVQISTKPIASQNAQVIDGKGKYLTPGLMDSHVHLRIMPGIIEHQGIPLHLQPLQQAFLAQQPKSYLYFGVTEILDLNQNAETIARFNQHQLKPDVAFCGAIGVLGGYGTFGLTLSQLKSTHRHVIFDPLEIDTLPDGVNASAHTAEYLVAKIAAQGASCIKLFFEDGFGQASHWPIVSDDLVQQVRHEAKKYNLVVFGHANAIDMQQIALDNQIDVLTHGMWNWNQFDGQPGLPDEIGDIVAQIIQQGTVFQPTFNVMDGLVGVLSDQVFSDPNYTKVVPKSVKEWYQSDEGKWFRKEFIADFDGLTPDQIRTAFAQKITQNERVVEALAAQDYPLVLASDTPSSPTFAAQPGYSTYQEIRHMHKAGLTLKQVFSAATLNNARAFGLEHEYGTVSPGMKANLLLLDKNPWQEIQAYDAIDKVIIGGEVIEREALMVQ